MKLYKNFRRNFRQCFASSLSYFPVPPPPKQIVEKLHILCSQTFSSIAKKFETTIIAEILKNVTKFLKHSIFRAEIFARLLGEILTKLSVLQQYVIVFRMMVLRDVITVSTPNLLHDQLGVIEDEPAEDSQAKVELHLSDNKTHTNRLRQETS